MVGREWESRLGGNRHIGIVRSWDSYHQLMVDAAVLRGFKANDRSSAGCAHWLSIYLEIDAERLECRALILELDVWVRDSVLCQEDLITLGTVSRLCDKMTKKVQKKKTKRRGVRWLTS